MASYHCKRVGELGLVSVASGNHHTLAGLDQCFARAALVENSKFGRHSRLQREAAQQGLAEGVDRRDFVAAGGFENVREKLSGPSDRRIARHAPGQFLQGLGERPRPQRRPIGQLLVQPVCHLGRGAEQELLEVAVNRLRPVGRAVLELVEDEVPVRFA